MIKPSSGHRRVNEQLLEYWQKLQQGRIFPAEEDINPDAIKDIWNSCFMVRHDVEDEGQPFRYIYLGQDLVDAYGDDLNDRETCEKLAYPQNTRLTQQFMQVISEQKPLKNEAEFANSKGMIVKYRSCLLPLAKDNPDVVGYIVGGMKWKAV